MNDVDCRSRRVVRCVNLPKLDTLRFLAAGRIPAHVHGLLHPLRCDPVILEVPCCPEVPQRLGMGVPGTGVEVGGGAAMLEGVVAVLDPGSVGGGTLGGPDLCFDPGAEAEQLRRGGESAVVAGAAVGIVGVGDDVKVFGGVGEVAGRGTAQSFPPVLAS